MTNQNNLDTKTVVITGASSGAGRAAALEFAQYQTNLVLASRNEGALNEVKAECEALSARALVVITDTSDARAMINLANLADDWRGGVDIWINNAGILAAGDFDRTPMAVHEQVIKTNLLGYMNGAHAVLPIFKRQGTGILINNISIGGFLPLPYGAGYAGSKFGLRGWSEALKGELTKWPGIHVCDLFPAFLDTPGIQHAGNYTGTVLKPAPPVYDPRRVAQAMVAVSQNPTSNKYIGSVSFLSKLAHTVLPELTTKLTDFMMRRYFNNAEPTALSDGNVFTTVDYGMAVYGGYGLPGKPKAHRKYIAAVFAGLAAGLYLSKIYAGKH